MAEAEPPDTFLCVLLPLLVKFKENDKLTMLSTEQLSSLYKFMLRELSLLKRRIPELDDITFMDPGEIKMHFKIPTNETALRKFFEYAKENRGSSTNPLERTVGRFFTDMSIELQLGLKLYAELHVRMSLDESEFWKKKEELKMVGRGNSKYSPRTTSETVKATTENREHCFLRLMVMCKNAHLSKQQYSELQRQLKDKINIMQKHFLENKKLRFVEIVDIHLESENLLVECAIPRNEESLCQLYEYAQKLEDKRRNVIEELMETCLEEIMGVEVSKQMQLYLFMPKVYFLKKQIELVDIDETFDEATQFESEKQKVKWVSKTLVVAVPTKSGEIVSSVKIISNSRLGGIRLVPRGNEGNLYHIEVNIPDRDIYSISYMYCAKISKYRLSVIPTSLKRESIELRLTDTPLQRDMFWDISHSDPKGIKEQVLDIFFSPGYDLDTMKSCVKELEIFFKTIRLPFQKLKEFVNPLLEEIKIKTSKKGLTLLSVLLAIVVPNVRLLHQVENLNCELTGMILEALQDYRLRELNMLNDDNLVNTCFTLCEIHFSTSFCFLKFMDTCYPFLDEIVIDQWFGEQLSTSRDINLVMGGWKEHRESAKRLCSRLYEMCLNGNSESIAMTLLSRIILHLPIGMAIFIAKELKDLSIDKKCPSHYDVQEKISELVYDFLKHEILDIVKLKDLDELYNLWNMVRESNFQSNETSNAFEKSVISLMIPNKNFSDENRKALLKLATDEYLFSSDKSQFALFKTLAESTSRPKHLLFLELIGIDKFEAVCSIERKELFQSWLKRAAEIDTAANTGKKVSRMYSTLADVLSVKQVNDDAELRVFLLEDVFQRLERTKLEEIFKEMSMIESTIKHDKQIEEVFNSHMSNLMRKKHAGRKAVELLQCICTQGRLRVNSRVTARIVALLLDGSIFKDSQTQDLIIFMEMVQESNFWKLIFEGNGCSMYLIRDNQAYKLALKCLHSVQHRFVKFEIPYSFLVEFNDDMRSKALDLLRITDKPPPKPIKDLWVKILNIFEEHMHKVDLLIRVFSRITDNLKEFSLSKKIQKITNELSSDEYKQLNANELKTFGIVETVIQRLFPTCMKLDGIVESTVFWNLGASKIMDRYDQYLSSPDKKTEPSPDEIIQSIASLFLETQTTKEDPADDDDTPLSSTDVEQTVSFCEIVLDIGVAVYKTEWERICTDLEFLLMDCYVMFEKAIYETEIDIAERYLHTNIPKSLKTTLDRLKQLPNMSKTITTLKVSLTSLKIDRSDDKEFYDAVASFENLLYGDSSSFTFCQVSEALETVYEIADPLSDDTISVLQAIGKSSKLIEFLQSIIDDDVRNLIDAVEDISEQHIQETTVSYLIEIKRFLHPLLKSSFDKRAQVFFNIIHKQTTGHGKSASSVPAKIEDCMDNLHNLKSLYNNVANRSEQTKDTIENIVKIGKFDFRLNNDESQCSFKATYTFKRNKRVHSRAALFDLRSRALLLTNKHEGTDGLKGKELEVFIGCIDSCAEISELVMQLHDTGHLHYKMYNESSYAASLTNLKEILKEENDRWKYHLEEVRNSHYLVNFLQGSQIYILHNFLESPLKQDGPVRWQDEAETLLKSIHPEITASTLKYLYDKKQLSNTGPNEYSFIKSVGQMLHCCYEELSFFERRLEDGVGKINRMMDVVRPGRIFVAHLDEKSPLVVKTILTLFCNTVRRLPEANQVLFCSDKSTWSEIELLIRRCLGAFEYFGKNVLHCIANVEALPNELQFKLVAELKNLETSARFLFAVICRGSKNHPFVDELNEFVCRVRPLSDKVVEQIFRTECPHVVAVSSNVAGLGKTTHISRTAFLSAHLQKTLHISGTFCKDEIVRRLKTMEIYPSSMLHMDVGLLSNSVEFDIFLFELIILRFVTTGRNSVYLSTSYVAIEIANSIQDSLRASLHTAVSFERLHLDWHDYKDFIVSHELHSPVQVVCHYLNELDRGDLDLVDIHLNGDKFSTPLSSSKCRDLLRKYFPSTDNMSFCLVNIFLNVLSDQLKKMSYSSFFKTSRIRDMVGNKTKPTIRSSLVNALVEVSKDFSSRSVDAYRATQVSTLEGSLDEGNIARDKGFAVRAAERTTGMIQWEDSNHLMYVFHNQNIQTISPVYRDKRTVPSHIKSLFESQMKKELQDYKKLSQPDLQVILQKVSRSNPLMLKEDLLQNLAKHYALTPDNLLKMILIMLRIKANIPVLVMGETGCGKTSLIRYLASICEAEFDVLNIHAGVEEDTVVKKVSYCDSQALGNPEKDYWLFFDEINTSEYVGLISDLICHRMFSGHVLAPNLVLLGACNPYKLRSAKAVSSAGLKATVLTDELSRLVYRVLPLPEMLVDYVWDFGSLDKQDEKLYISRMTENVFHEQKKYHSIFTELLSMSQAYIREKDETAYCVSLRDVTRCKTLACWFMDILKKKKSLKNKEGVYCPLNTQETAIVLSLAHCYQSRISDTYTRKTYRQAISDVFNRHGSHFDEKDIDSVIKKEQDDILNRMELPPGTAKNTALRENVFVLLVCILNKIPIFVVGKPGCSKSLSMQVIRSNLRGGDSKDDFFKMMPQLYCVSFQGSESSTSEGIIKVFEKAERYQESNKADDVMSVVILDEIGLAEVSRFNPLKVLHNLLEPSGRDRPNVAVVGISNWSLDASKMNRAIHLSRPDMDENELFETGMSIFDSFVVLQSSQLAYDISSRSYIETSPQLKTEDFREDLKHIASSYLKYSQVQTFQNFHGLRDFYSLVKYFAKEIVNKPKVTDEEKNILIMKGLERNFGGLPSERSALMSAFDINGTNQPCPVNELIKTNVEDGMARHLMLITTGESVLGILDYLLDATGRQNRELIFGSQFEEDLTDDYNYRILNRIIICMEQGVVLILKDLESIYGSLYDMLNQNYTIIGKKKNCRVALGPYSNPICHVSSTFRCIVIIDESKLKYSDPPFLNRFEKQHLRFSDIISPWQNDLIQKMNDWVKSVCVMDHFDEYDAFPIFGDDMISSLILKLSNDGALRATYGETAMLKKCKLALLWIIRPEVVIRLQKNSCQELQDEFDQLIKEYFDLPVHNGIGGLLDSHLDKDKMSHTSDKNLLTMVFTNSNIHRKALLNVNRWSLQIEKLGSFKSEKQLSLRMHVFWHESDRDILILHCSAIDDEKHIMLAKSKIERYRQEFISEGRINQCKHVYFVIHMDRSKGRSTILSKINFMSFWKLVTLDSLEQPQIVLSRFCTMSLHEALLEKRPFNEFIKDKLFWAFTRIKYAEVGRSIDSITDMILRIQSSEEVLDILDELVYTYLKTYSDIDDFAWQSRVACDCQALQTSSSFIEAIENYISQLICKPLAKYIYKMEYECILDTLFIDDDSSENRREILKAVIFDYKQFSISKIQDETGPESYVCSAVDLQLKTPFSKVIFDTIETMRDEFINSVKMLKVRCGVEPEDELPNEILLELEKKQNLVVCHKIPLVLQLNYKTALKDYIEDFCSIVSFRICPNLPRNKRVYFTQWMLSDYLRLKGEDFSEGLVSTHIVFWNHTSLFTSKLKLLETCDNLLTASDLTRMNIKPFPVSFKRFQEGGTVHLDNKQNKTGSVSEHGSAMASKENDEFDIGSKNVLGVLFSSKENEGNMANVINTNGRDIFVHTMTSGIESGRHLASTGHITCQPEEIEQDVSLTTPRYEVNTQSENELEESISLLTLETCENGTLFETSLSANVPGLNDSTSELKDPHTKVLASDVDNLQSHSSIELTTETDLSCDDEVDGKLSAEQPEKTLNVLPRSFSQNEDVAKTDTCMSTNNIPCQTQSDMKDMDCAYFELKEKAIEANSQRPTIGDTDGTLVETKSRQASLESVVLDDLTSYDNPSDSEGLSTVSDTGSLSESGSGTLVQIVCMKMLPTPTTLKHYKTIKLWHIQANFVLTLVGKVCPEARDIHYLRICSDIVSTLIIPYGLETVLIERVASCIQADDALDSCVVFETLFDIIKLPLPGSEGVRQRIFADYLFRCILSNPESRALSYLMNLVAKSMLPDTNVTVFKKVFKLALEYELEEERNIHFKILKTELPDHCSGQVDDVSDAALERLFITDLNYMIKCLVRDNNIDCPFLILVIDIFEDLFADAIDTADADDSEFSGPILENLMLSQKLITEGHFNLQLVTAIGYFKACVKYSLATLNITNLKEVEFINAIIGCKSNRTIQEYVWKILAHERRACNVKSYLSELKEVLPAVQEIPCSDDYLNNCFDRCPVLVFAESRIEYMFEDLEAQDGGLSNDKFMSILTNAQTSTESLLFLFGYAERMFYIPRSYSLLDDKTKYLADTILKLLNECSLNRNANHLLQCLLGKEDFRISNFMHSEQSSHLDCLINVFLTSVYSLITIHSNSAKPLRFFQRCLYHAADIVNCFIPANSDRSQRDQSVQSGGVWFATCSCRHRLAVFDSILEQVLCPVCDNFTKRCDKEMHECEEVEKRSELFFDESLKSSSYSVGKLSPIACQIISLIIKGCILGFLALGHGRPEQLENLIRKSHIDISNSLWRDLERHWHNIGELLGVGESTVGRYLHAVLKHTQDILFVTCSEMTNAPDRLKWEKDFEVLVQNVTQERCTRYQDMIQRYRTICGVTQNEFEDSLMEMNKVDSGNPLATCFRMKNRASIENFKSELFPVRDKFPILNLILTRENDLMLSVHIHTILKWHMSIVSSANYTIRKHECLELTVNDFIKKVDDTNKSDILSKRFRELQRSWLAIIDLLKEHPLHNEMERIHTNMKMGSCIIHDGNSIQYKVLKFLVERQNEFLDDALSIANRCDSVQFLMGTEITAVLPCLCISDITSVHLIGSSDAPLNWNELLEDNAHSRTTYGQGQMIMYDFYAIESILADRVLLGRAFVQLGSLPTIIFTDELYKNYVSLSHNIRDKVEQMSLTSEMKASIIERHINDTRFSKELLMQIGMLMTLVNKTGGDPNKSLIDYVDGMKSTLTKKFSDDLLPSPHSAFKLCHIVATYEILEELNAEPIIDALEDRFGQELSMDLVKHFENMVETNTRLGSILLSTCKRFISRCLSLREADESRPLLDYLSDDSFWPEGVKSGNIIRCGNCEERVEDSLPKDVMVNNIRCLVYLISEGIENQRIEKMEMTRIATSWQTAQRSKYVVIDKRKQNVATRKRRNMRL